MSAGSTLAVPAAVGPRSPADNGDMANPLGGPPPAYNDRWIAVVKMLHTLIWASIESCVVYVVVAGLLGRTDRRVAVAGAVVAGECAVFAANGFRCPLSDVAESLGAERGSVTDLYLPARFARNLPAIHVPVIVLAVFLHLRNWKAVPPIASEGSAAQWRSVR